MRYWCRKRGMAYEIATIRSQACSVQDNTGAKGKGLCDPLRGRRNFAQKGRWGYNQVLNLGRVACFC